MSTVHAPVCCCYVCSQLSIDAINVTKNMLLCGKIKKNRLQFMLNLVMFIYSEVILLLFCYYK